MRHAKLGLIGQLNPFEFNNLLPPQCAAPSPSPLEGNGQDRNGGNSVVGAEEFADLIHALARYENRKLKRRAIPDG
jgi:hypothetical protein